MFSFSNNGTCIEDDYSNDVEMENGHTNNAATDSSSNGYKNGNSTVLNDSLDDDDDDDEEVADGATRDEEMGKNLLGCITKHLQLLM